MKIFGNWGLAVTVFYITFVVALVTLVVIVSQDKVDLVVQDYYAQDQIYQQQIDKIVRTKALTEQVKIINSGNSIVVKFPENIESQISGDILLYKPDNSKLDVTIPIETNENKIQIINSDNLTKGFWKVKIDWVCNDSAYFNEDFIILN